MPLVGFEPTIAVFERAKTLHALDSAVTVIGAIRRHKLMQLPEGAKEVEINT
jgi:hypothetical protein